MATRTRSHSTIGQLARQAGVSAQTLRHYDRLGLLHPTAMSAGGYRLYTEDDRSRLELIRALRALDIDLATIGQLLRGAAGVRRVAELHLRTLDHQVRTLERRRAVLRVLLRAESLPTADRLTRLQALAGFERLERERFLAEQLDRRLSGAASSPLRQWIQKGAAVDLPESPTEAQVEAWLELAEMVSDPRFLERHRRGASSGVMTPLSGTAATRWPKEMMAVYASAAKAVQAGVEPSSHKALPIVRRWVGSFANREGRRDVRAFAEQMLRAIDTHRDAREERFWQLVGVLKPEVARSPMSVAWPWLVAGLRGWLAGGRTASRGSR